ncbi:hypothetical protein G6F31_017989 [Rhizopus arrhizus]|nr:hypothetical protein G6F31_017989 [Rhizopus arrhizus]
MRSRSVRTLQRGGELHHAAQVLVREAAPVVAHKLRRQGRQDFLAVPGPLAGQHLRMDALADTPEQQGQFGIDRQDGALPRRLNQCPNVAQQRRRRCGGRHGYFAPVHAATPSACRAPVIA